MDEKNPRWVVFYEWTTDEHETRIRSGVVVVQRSWTFRETFPHDDKNAAILCYRKALRGEWVKPEYTSWGVSSPNPELEEIFHGRPVPMPAYIREKLAALNLRIEG